MSSASSSATATAVTSSLSYPRVAGVRFMTVTLPCPRKWLLNNFWSGNYLLIRAFVVVIVYFFRLAAFADFFCQWLVVHSYPAPQRGSIRRQELAGVKLSNSRWPIISSIMQAQQQKNVLLLLPLTWHPSRPTTSALPRRLPVLSQQSAAKVPMQSD